MFLDVGAGNGRLAYFLRRAMEDMTNQGGGSQKLPKIIASNDGSWRAPMYDNKHIEVEKLSAVESLDKYGPKKDTRLIVLCSWMPPGQDWTADFHRPIYDEDNDRVGGLAEEYILIGEADDGTCGHHWYAWGNPNVLVSNEDDEESKDEEVPPPELPYASDGYERVDLNNLMRLQFSRFDCKCYFLEGQHYFK